MLDRVQLLNIYQMSVAPNGFPEKAKQRLLEASEEVEEPECVDHTLVAPSEARCRKNYLDLNDENDENDENETRTILVKKRNYEQKFECEKFDAAALQLIPNDTKKQSTMKAKKGKNAYDKLPIENLIPNLKFTEKHKLDENSLPAHWLV